MTSNTIKILTIIIFILAIGVGLNLDKDYANKEKENRIAFNDGQTLICKDKKDKVFEVSLDKGWSLYKEKKAVFNRFVIKDKTVLFIVNCRKPIEN